jgi:peptidoglycan/LPS O-acetylase OafA/YrhL
MSEQNQEPTRSPDSPASTPGSQTAGTPPVAPAPAPGDWRAERYAGRAARREARAQRRGGRSGAWIGGAVLILIGLVLLLQNMGIGYLTNWWALFILIPALVTLAAAWNSYRANGRLTQRGAGLLAGGVLVTILAVVLLFNVNLGSLGWPVLLIVGGLILLGAGLLGTSGRDQNQS